MKKIIILQTITILFIGFTYNTKKHKSVVKGKVHDWPTDTVYISNVPYYSPFSAVVDYKIISKDSTFTFEFKDQEEPFIVFISPEKTTVQKTTKELLFENRTEDRCAAHCEGLCNHSATTYLIEPEEELILDVTFNCSYNQLSQKKADCFGACGAKVDENNRARNVEETKILCKTQQRFDYQYYQEKLDLNQAINNSVDSTESIESAATKYNELKKHMLSKLDSVKDSITPFLYKHLCAQVDFSVRKEFLKFLRFEADPSYLEDLFSKELPDYVTNMVEFNKKELDHSALLSDEYNEYLELYLNFKISALAGKYIEYKKFDKSKYDFAQEELPEISKYYYLANNLLQAEKLNDGEELVETLLAEYPQGELNDKLSEKYLLERDAVVLP